MAFMLKNTNAGDPVSDSRAEADVHQILLMCSSGSCRNLQFHKCYPISFGYLIATQFKGHSITQVRGDAPAGKVTVSLLRQRSAVLRTAVRQEVLILGPGRQPQG